MAKSFKKGPPSGSTLLKPTSERDFFDLLEDRTAEPSPRPAGSAPVTALPGAAVLVPNGNTGKQVILGDTPVTEEHVSFLQKPAPDVELSREVVATPVASPPRRQPVTEQPDQPIGVPAGIAASPVAPAPAATAASVSGLPATESKGVRQTFVVGAQYLEQLRDFVHAQRASGAYWYSQRQAIEEGLALLIATRGPLTQRPDYIQEREQERRVRIQKGRREGRTPKDPPSSP